MLELSDILRLEKPHYRQNRNCTQVQTTLLYMPAQSGSGPTSDTLIQ